MPLQEILHQGKCPADLLEERWEGELGQDLNKLIEYSAYKLSLVLMDREEVVVAFVTS